MKVNKLVSKNQNEDWFERITNECKREYPVYMMGELKSDELVLDCGCNVGGFAEAYKHRFTNFLAIDASSYNIEEYQKHHHHPTLHKALYSTDEKMVQLRKFIAGDNDTNSGNFGITGIELNGNGWIGDEYEEVETLSLDTLIKPYDTIGLLKVDIEGAEYDFLMGKDLSKIKWITMELHNFLGVDKHKELMNWITKTHEEVYSDGNGNETHYQKAWRRKELK